MMKERTPRQSLRLNYPTPQNEATAYESQALAELRAAGFRITMPRIQVIRALSDTKKALNAYAIHEKILDSGGKIDVVSVYRILATLQDVGLIHHIGVVDGYYPCRLTNCREHKSEVLICEETGAVIELTLPQSVVQEITEQVRQKGYELSGIKVELTANRRLML